MIEIESDLLWTDARAIADDIVFRDINQHLSDIEIKVLQASWEQKTYDDMAKDYGYSAEYLNKDVGNKLWRKLPIAIGERVTKKNFKEALRRCRNNHSQADKMPTSEIELPFPEGAVALDSPLYIERDGVEALCYETILKPGALLRIKAPKLMGKTSLITRISSYATHQNYQVVYLDLGSVDRAILTNLDKFLRWLCLIVGRQLKLENHLNDYWDTDILGSNDNCTTYFEEYLLPQLDCPLVLGLDDVDRIFPYTAVVEDFLGLLRSWHEKGKIAAIWQRLRLVIAHSTEIYIPLDINQSPFNAGVPVELIEFDREDVQTLADRHHLSWQNAQIDQLMQMVGGHPYLVRLAMYEASLGKVTLQRLLQEAATETGIFSTHLRRHLMTLQQAPTLNQALKQVVSSSEAIELDSLQIYKLRSMGLVKGHNNQVMPSCQLYREYFHRIFV